MKILMLSDLYPPHLGGIETHVRSLSHELCKRGHRVVVCTMGRRDLPQCEDDGGVRVIRFEGLFQRVPSLFKDPARRWHPPVKDPLVSRRLAQVIREERPDVIHAHGWILYSVLDLKRAFGVPLVYTLHDYRLFCPRMTLLRDGAVCDRPSILTCVDCVRRDYGLPRALAACYGVRSNRKRLKGVDRFIAVSAFTREACERHLGIGDAGIVTIPSFCEPAPDDHGDVAGLPDDFILYVGWLMPHKGIDVLIEAYRALDTRTALLIMGIEHPRYSYRSTDNTIIMKNADHRLVLRAMSEARFVVVPSVCPEGFPMVAHEAMSRGKALVASNVGGLREAVVDGENGILVRPNDPHDLARAMSYLLDNPEVASRMGDSAYGRHVESYSVDAVVPRIIEVYEDLA